MMRKWFINLLSVIILAIGLFAGLTELPAIAASSVNNSAVDKIETSLADEFSTKGSTDFIVGFSAQADLSTAYSMDWEARGEFVYRTLNETATRSQFRARSMLDTYGFEYQTFIAGNQLYVKLGNLDMATKLANLDEVLTIRASRVYSIELLEDINHPLEISWSGEYLAQNLNASVGSDEATISWGIVDTKADQFWTAFSVEGDGIKVANIDTGVQYNHPALDQAFACQDDPSSLDCWYDPYGSYTFPVDPVGHGTHVMGTMVADNDPTLTYIAGMAPNATWIACRGCSSTSCTEPALLACADWILAPGEDPVNRPNVVNSSWSYYDGSDPFFISTVNAWKASGIFPSFVAGNTGPNCGTIGAPGSYQESFATAAHDSNRLILSASGRGPSDFGHDPYTKPNISAPGVGIWSSTPLNSWAQASGTSQAGPHSAGAVALLWSCNPSLVGRIDETYQILQYAANLPPVGTCGVPPDGLGNYTYGYGYLDVLAAGTAYCGVTDQGTIEGYVYDNHGNPLEGVSISAWPSGISVQENASVQSITDPTGYYSMELLVGTYDISTYKENYESQTQTGIDVFMDDTTYVPPFILDFIGTWIEYDNFPGCPDWRRYDGEYFPDTGKIYFLGGRTELDSNPTTLEMFPDIYAFDPVEGLCTDTGTDMAVTISNYTIVPLEVDGKDVLCTFGGYDLTGNATDVVQCYDPIANSVSQPATLPPSMTRYIPGGVENVDNQAYIFGGLAFSAPYETAETWKWDPVSKLWTRLGDMIKGVSYTQSAVVDGVIYSFGGTIVNTVTPSQLISQKVAQMLDPSKGFWVQLAEMPTACGEGRAFGFDSDTEYELTNQVVVVGGGVFPGETREAFLYDIATNTYDYDFPDLNVARRNQAGVLVPGEAGGSLIMWVFGGRSSDDGYGREEPPYAPPESYEVELTLPRILVNPPSLNKNVLVDTPRTVAFDILNIGGGSLNWSITEDGGDVSWLSASPDEGINNGTVAVTFDPTGLEINSYYAALLIANYDPLNPVLTYPITMTVVIQEAGVSVSPATVEKGGNPGAIVEYPLVISNTGNYIDTFTLEAEGDWDVILPFDSVELENGESTIVRVKVIVPEDALAGSSELTTIKAISDFNPEVFDSSALTTSANTTYGLVFDPAIKSTQYYPNKTVTYTLELFNTGNVEDTITLTKTGNLWEVQLSVTSLTIPAYSSAEITVYVTIPLIVKDGGTDTVTVTATSESELTTNAKLTTQAIYYRIRLPIVPK